MSEESGAGTGGDRPRSVGGKFVLGVTTAVVATFITASYIDRDTDRPATTPAPLNFQRTGPSKQFGSKSSTKLHRATCGVLDASNASGADERQRLTSMNLAAAGRAIRQPPEAFPELRFADTVRTKPYEVVQISTIVVNWGPEATAREVRMRLHAPTYAARAMSLFLSVEAANVRPDDRRPTADVVALVSHTGRPFRLDNFRSVAVQQNQSKNDFYWGRYEYFPTCALESKRGERSFEVVIPSPSVDGHLSVGLDDAYRVSVLADVIPG